MLPECLERYAHLLVNHSIAVKPGSIVVIEASTTNLDMVRAVYKAVLAADCHPILDLGDCQCEDILYHIGSHNQLKFVGVTSADLIKKADGWIILWGDDNTKALSRVNPEKIAIRANASATINDLWNERTCAFGTPNHLPWVGAQVPCHSAAQDANMSLSQFETTLFEACLLYEEDPVGAWRKMLKKQIAINRVLNTKRQFIFVSTNGTNITFTIPKDRKWWTCAGKENMPDGEVYTSPYETSATGTFVASYPSIYEGVCVDGVILKFVGGKVVDFSCSNRDFMKSMLDCDAGSRFIGELAFGLNPRIQTSCGSILFDEKIGGTFHIALGGAYSNTGGTNKSNIHWDLVCDLRNSGIVYADGEAIQRNGLWVGEVKAALEEER